MKKLKSVKMKPSDRVKNFTCRENFYLTCDAYDS